jgi:sugar phosphate isomerase/epimerase
MKFAICNETFQGWEWGASCRFVAEAGYNGIEIAPYTLAEDVRMLTPETRRSIRRIAEDAGLEIAGLHWLLVSPRGLSVTSANEALRKATSEYLVALADFCHDVGGRIMVFGSPNQRRIPEGETAEIAAERFLVSVRPALDRAAEYGITLCLEPLPPPEANFLLTLAEAAALIRRLDHPAAKTILDVKSASAEAHPVPDLIARYAPLLAHVHANDANRRGPGFGRTDFGPILRALNAVRYAGYVSVEVFDYSPDPQTIATESLKYLKEKMQAVS